jgi:hypothetical protein
MSSGPMITDPLPRTADERRQYARSDAVLTVPVPEAEELQGLASDLELALQGGEVEPVQLAGDALIALLARFYGTPVPPLTVLGVRPHRTREGRLAYELFGDYTHETQAIRVWMRTAIRGKVTSYRGLLNTLVHEYLHHLDVCRLGLPDTPHTRGFYHRIDVLYHHALATPPERRKPLVWIKRGSLWAIDWSKLR